MVYTSMICCSEERYLYWQTKARKSRSIKVIVVNVFDKIKNIRNSYYIAMLLTHQLI